MAAVNKGNEFYALKLKYQTWFIKILLAFNLMFLFLYYWICTKLYDISTVSFIWYKNVSSQSF